MGQSSERKGMDIFDLIEINDNRKEKLRLSRTLMKNGPAEGGELNRPIVKQLRSAADATVR